jgi:hypothetical protein
MQDVYQADAALRAGTTGKIDGRGLDGSKISRELGFEYQHTDIAASIREAALSMVEHGVVDGKRHTMPVILVLLAVVAAVLLFLVWRVIQLLVASSGGGKLGGSARSKAD